MKESKRFMKRSRCLQMIFKIGVLKSFAIFTGKCLCWRLFLIKLQAFRPATLLRIRLRRMCFPMNIAEFLRTTLFIEHLQWLLSTPWMFSCKNPSNSMWKHKKLSIKINLKNFCRDKPVTIYQKNVQLVVTEMSKIFKLLFQGTMQRNT